jgi:NADPH:quinone reductase-like Zn-dependent oxidoreductase
MGEDAMATAREIPTKMKAAAVDRFGPPTNVHTELLPVPRLGTKEVLVEVAVAGVGVWDPYLIDGSFQTRKPRFPEVFGSDGAGTVAAIGSGVKRFAVGDRVYGWGFGNAKGGFFAEYAAIRDKDLSPIPDNLSFAEAGVLAVAGITALQGLDKLGIQAGEDVMIFGASGGVGHVAVQLAKRLGLRVFATASHEDGVELAIRVGADAVAEGHRQFVPAAREFAPDGFAGALVFASGDGWKHALQLVARGGRVAWPNGVEPTPRVPRGVKRVPYDGEATPKALERLSALVSRGPFHVEIPRVYGLDEAAQALQDVQRHHIGKLAIHIH